VGTVNGQGVVYDAETKQAIVTFNGLTGREFCIMVRMRMMLV
jgi:hypothetical protein